MNTITLRVFEKFDETRLEWNFEGDEYLLALEDAMWELFKAEPCSDDWEDEIEKTETTYFERGYGDYPRVELVAMDYYWIIFPSWEEEED